MKLGKGKLGEYLELKVIVGNVTQGQQGRRAELTEVRGCTGMRPWEPASTDRQASPKAKQKGL